MTLRRGNGFGRLGIGVPYFKGCYDFFRWWTWLVAGGFEEGDELLNGYDVPGEVPIPMAHNAIVREFLKTECDTLCIIEDDHVADQEVVRRMRTKLENLDFDIVCASYTNRRVRPLPMGWVFNRAERWGWECRFQLDEVALTGTQEYDGAGVGLALVRRWVLEAMLGDQRPDRFFWFEWVGQNSQDVAFYAKAKEIGARVGVDRDNWIGHVGQYVWTKDDFVRWRDSGSLQQPADKVD